MTYFVQKSEEYACKIRMEGTTENCQKLIDWHNQLTGCTLTLSFTNGTKPRLDVDKVFSLIKHFNEDFQREIINMFNFTFNDYRISINVAKLRALTGTEPIQARFLRNDV